MFLTSITLICLGAAVEEPPVPQVAERGAERLGMAEQEAGRRFDGTPPRRLGLGALHAFAVNDRGDLLILALHPVRRADGTIVVYPVGQVYAAGSPGWVPYELRRFERQDDAGWHDYAERPDDAGHQDDQHWQANDASLAFDASLDGDQSRMDDLSYGPIIVHPPLEPDQTLDAWVQVVGDAFLIQLQARDGVAGAQQAGGMQGTGAEPKTRIVDYYHGLDPLQEQRPQSRPGAVIFYPAGDAFAVLVRNAGPGAATATRR